MSERAKKQIAAAEGKISLLLRISEYFESVSEDLDKFVEELYDMGGEVCGLLVSNDLEKSATAVRKEAAYIRKLAEAVRAWEETP